jgi:hypothetical protein
MYRTYAPPTIQKMPTISCVVGISPTRRGEVINRKSGVNETKGMAKERSELCKALMNWNMARKFKVPPMSSAHPYLGPSEGTESVNSTMVRSIGMGVAQAANAAS